TAFPPRRVAYQHAIGDQGVSGFAPNATTVAEVGIRSRPPSCSVRQRETGQHSVVSQVNTADSTVSVRGAGNRSTTNYGHVRPIHATQRDGLAHGNAV